MENAVSDTLPFALAIAVSPLPIVAVILVLLSHHPRSNGLAFIVGWILGLAIAEGIVLTLVSLFSLTPGGGPTTIVAILRLAIGLLLLILGIRQWRKRSAPGAQPDMPRWMRSIDDATPARTLGLAALLSSVGNVALILAAAAAITRGKLDIGQEAAALGAFVLIGSLTVAAVVIYHVFAGAAASKILNGWKTWLLLNTATIMAILLIVVGAVLVAKGLGGLNMLG